MMKRVTLRLPEPGRSESDVLKQRPPDRELFPNAQTVQTPPEKLDWPAGQAMHDTPPAMLDFPAGQDMHVPLDEMLPI